MQMALNITAICAAIGALTAFARIAYREWQNRQRLRDPHDCRFSHDLDLQAYLQSLSEDAQ